MDSLPFGIYIHWPYCARICPYCDFNVYRSKGEDGGALIAAIVKDLHHWRGLSGPRHLSSVHFGGGTPSLLTPAQIAALLNTISKLWGIRADREIAIEANPSDADKERWRGYMQTGINRLSLGVQSFDDRVLSFLGRDHDGDMARRALDLAVSIFPRVSADMIFGHIGQNAQDWSRDLDIALGSGATHLSCYQLTIEPGTAFDRAQARGQEKAVDEDLSADLYAMTRERLLGEGFEHYEVSNFAKNGRRSIHNMIYWQGGDYVGVGPGAHGRLTIGGARVATVAHKTPGAYMKGVRDAGHGIAERERLSHEDHASEYVLMGLRISGGLSLARYAQIAGAGLNPHALDSLIADGLLTQDGDRLSATDEGRVLLNSVTEKLLT